MEPLQNEKSGASEGSKNNEEMIERRDGKREVKTMENININGNILFFTIVF
jgi:hypothetical protein